MLPLELSIKSHVRLYIHCKNGVKFTVIYCVINSTLLISTMYGILFNIDSNLLLTAISQYTIYEEILFAVKFYGKLVAV